MGFAYWMSIRSWFSSVYTVVMSKEKCEEARNVHLYKYASNKRRQESWCVYVCFRESVLGSWKKGSCLRDTRHPIISHNQCDFTTDICIYTCHYLPVLHNIVYLIFSKCFLPTTPESYQFQLLLSITSQNVPFLSFPIPSY